MKSCLIVLACFLYLPLIFWIGGWEFVRSPANAYLFGWSCVVAVFGWAFTT